MDHTDHNDPNVLEIVFSLENEEDLGVLDLIMESVFHHYFGWDDTCLDDFKGFDRGMFFDGESLRKNINFMIRFEGQYTEDFFSENPKTIPAKLSMKEIVHSD